MLFCITSPQNLYFYLDILLRKENFCEPKMQRNWRKSDLGPNEPLQGRKISRALHTTSGAQDVTKTPCRPRGNHFFWCVLKGLATSSRVPACINLIKNKKLTFSSKRIDFLLRLKSIRSRMIPEKIYPNEYWESINRNLSSFYTRNRILLKRSWKNKYPHCYQKIGLKRPLLNLLRFEIFICIIRYNL